MKKLNCIWLIFLFSLNAYALRQEKFIWDGFSFAEEQKINFFENRFRILWWNIEEGFTSSKFTNHPLDLNLIELIRSDFSPDIIVLAEFKNSALRTGTLRILRNEYFEKFIPYNENTPGQGIIIFSKIKLEYLSVDTLKWCPPEESPQCKSFEDSWLNRSRYAKGFTRQYIQIKVFIPSLNRVVSLVPVHLLQPWSIISDQHSFRLLAYLEIGSALFYSASNPLRYQIEHLRHFLERDFGNFNQDAVVLFGDFNLPRNFAEMLSLWFENEDVPSFLHKKSTLFEFLKKGLVDLFEKNSKPTFPTLFSKSFGYIPQVQIDHAFSSTHLSPSTEVLTLRGSDHYPIYIGL